jgi:hypothetical protein
LLSYAWPIAEKSDTAHTCTSIVPIFSIEANTTSPGTIGLTPSGVCVGTLPDAAIDRDAQIEITGIRNFAGGYQPRTDSPIAQPAMELVAFKKTATFWIQRVFISGRKEWRG